MARRPGISKLPEYCEADLLQLFQNWFDQIKYQRRLSPRTCIMYESDVTHLVKFFMEHKGFTIGSKHMANLDITDFRSWMVFMTNQGLSASSRAIRLAGIRTFFEYADKQGHFHNPYPKMLSTPKRPHKVPRPIGTKQASEFVNFEGDGSWADLRDKAIFMLLYGSGLRIAEALALKVSDWPSNDDELKVMGKGRKERLVPLLPLVQKAVQNYKESAPFIFDKDDPLFQTAKGKPVYQQMVQAKMRHLRRQLGLPETATPHALRHSFATHLLDNGANIREVQELLGHASLSTTQRYTEVSKTKILEEHRKAHPSNRK